MMKCVATAQPPSATSVAIAAAAIAAAATAAASTSSSTMATTTAASDKTTGGDNPTKRVNNNGSKEASSSSSSQDHNRQEHDQQLLDQQEERPLPPPQHQHQQPLHFSAAVVAAAAAAATQAGHCSSTNGDKEVLTGMKDNAQQNHQQQQEKKISNNNNTTSYTSSGRLKIFKEGRCLVELTHGDAGDSQSRGGSWIPITKKVYWPPPATSTTIKSESSGYNASDAVSECDGSSSISSSCWPPPLPCSSSATTMTTSTTVTSKKPRSHQCCRKNPRPVKLRNLSHPDLSFVMKPPPRIVSLRKKIRELKRRRRQPYLAIVVGAFLMKFEGQAVTSRPKPKPFVNDRIKKSSRLESVISKLSFLVSKKKTTALNIPISTWGFSKGKKSKHHQTQQQHQRQQQQQAPPQKLMKVGSVLCPVTETCTAASMPSNSKSGGTRKVIAETAMVQVNSRILPPGSPSTHKSKTMPITPTLARIIGDQQSSSGNSSSSVIMSPDTHMVTAVEISGPRMNYVPVSTTSSDRGGFTSPRKRYLKDAEVGSPVSKRHRSSTDSRGSSTESPQLLNFSSPPHPPQPQQQQQHPPRMSSFSIDSIMSSSSSSKDERDGSGKLVKPVAMLPASPARIGEIRREFSSESDALSHGSRTPTPAARSSPVRSRSPPSSATPAALPPPATTTAPLVPIAPYVARNLDSKTAESLLDPRLAHLAGVRADPRLGLTPVGASAFPFSLMNPYSYLANNPFMQQVAAHQAQAAALAAAAMSPLPPTSLSSRLNWPPSHPPQSPLSTGNSSTLRITLPCSPHRSTSATSSTTTVSSSAASSFSLWPPQYRGEPKIEPREMRSQSPDTPLNLSMK